MDNLRAVLDRDQFARLCGMTVVSAGEGRAVTRVELKPHHLNGVDIVQGGVIFTLADLAFAAASNSRGPVAVAINCSINFVRAVTGGTLTATATETAANPKMASYTVEIADQDGQVVAVFQGLAYRKKS